MTATDMEIQLIDITHCLPSPLLAHVPLETEVIARLRKSKEESDIRELKEREEAWEAWLADAAANGIRDAIKVVQAKSGWHVVDGRNRLSAAQAAGMDTIPAVVVTGDEAMELVLGSLAHRKKTTKGGLAYLALTIHPHLATGKAGRKKESPGHRGINSLIDLAAKIGVGMTTMEQAAEVFRHFEETPIAKNLYEGLLISGAKSLDSAMKNSGIAGATATKGQPRAESSYSTATKTIKTLTNQLKDAAAWDEAETEAAHKAFTDAFSALSPAARALLADSLQAAEES